MTRTFLGAPCSRRDDLAGAVICFRITTSMGEFQQCNTNQTLRVRKDRLVQDDTRCVLFQSQATSEGAPLGIYGTVCAFSGLLILASPETESEQLLDNLFIGEPCNV